MYDIEKYRSARRAGVKPAMALAFARGGCKDWSGVYAAIWVSQRPAVRYMQILVRLGRYTWDMSGRSRWNLASHSVRNESYRRRKHAEELAERYPEPDYEL